MDFAEASERSGATESVKAFTERCILVTLGDRVSDMLAYLTYVAWYIDIYEAGPSASYEQFVSGIRLVGLKIERDQSDIRWIVDVTLKKTPIDFMSSDERQTFANILSRGRG